MQSTTRVPYFYRTSGGFLLLSSTTRALIVPGMVIMPVRCWRSCADLVTVTQFEPYLYDCTRLSLLVRHPAKEFWHSEEALEKSEGQRRRAVGYVPKLLVSGEELVLDRKGVAAEVEWHGAVQSGGPHHQDSGEAKIRESTAGVSRKPSSDGKARGCSSKHLCGLTAWNT